MLFSYTGLVLLFFCAGGAYAASAFRRRIEWTLPATVMAYTLILFAAAGFNRLEIGWMMLCALSVILWLATLARLCRIPESRKNFRENFLTPGLLLIIITSIVLLSMTRTITLVPLSDEFTHWGEIAKELYFTNALPVFNKITTVRFTDYPPATSLLQYIFFKLYGNYSEGIAFFAQSFLAAFSLVAPVLVRPCGAAVVLL